ncbi:acyl-CoA dehydrogenase C-terminal domain-containing protein, partial [Burkholderia sp. SIMBA_045]
QALDLLGRKVFGSQGQLLQPFNEEIQSFLDETVTGSEWIKQREQLQQALNILNGVSEEVLQKAAGDENLVNSVAVEYLHLVGY